MSRAAHAIANNDIVHIAWSVDSPIPDCAGFVIYRQPADGSTDWEPLRSLIEFEDEHVDDAARPTTVTPVTKFQWRDFLDRDSRDRAIRYKIVAVRKAADCVRALPDVQPLLTNDVTPTEHLTDGVEVYFNRGILATQALEKLLAPYGGANVGALQKALDDPKGVARTRLSGELEKALLSLLEERKTNRGRCYAALYELTDKVLIDALLKAKGTLRLVLSNNTGDQKKGYDYANSAARSALAASTVRLLSRYLPDGRSIGHNKFVVLADGSDHPQAVLTGSTNWTRSGLCTQNNNAIIVRSPDLAAEYVQYLAGPRGRYQETRDTQQGQGRLGASGPGAAGRRRDASADYLAAGRQDDCVGVVRTEHTDIGPKVAQEQEASADAARHAGPVRRHQRREPGRPAAGVSARRRLQRPVVDGGQGARQGLQSRSPGSSCAAPSATRRKRWSSRNCGPRTWTRKSWRPPASSRSRSGGSGRLPRPATRLSTTRSSSSIRFWTAASSSPAVTTSGSRPRTTTTRTCCASEGNRAIAEAYAAHVADVFQHYRWRWYEQRSAQRRAAADWVKAGSNVAQSDRVDVKRFYDIDFDPTAPKEDWQARYFDEGRLAMRDREFWVGTGQRLKALQPPPGKRRVFGYTSAERALAAARKQLKAQKKAAKTASAKGAPPPSGNRAKAKRVSKGKKRR